MLQGCGKGIRKINQVPTGGQEVKMKRNGEVVGLCDYVLCLLIVIMNRNQVMISINM